MKFTILALALSFSLSALATPVDGTITYKLPTGDLVDRDVVLEVPSRGQGEVVLSGKSFEWKTKKFKSYKSSGRDIFVAVFNTEFMGKKSKLIFRGTYFKGNNKLIYTGNIFKKKKRKLDHIGLFNFNFDR
jgi:hypothetical protein